MKPSPLRQKYGISIIIGTQASRGSRTFADVGESCGGRLTCTCLTCTRLSLESIAHWDVFQNIDASVFPENSQLVDVESITHFTACDRRNDSSQSFQKASNCFLATFSPKSFDSPPARRGAMEDTRRSGYCKSVKDSDPSLWTRAACGQPSIPTIRLVKWRRFSLAPGLMKSSICLSISKPDPLYPVYSSPRTSVNRS
ncbi:hypothetical protein SCHPADRAFT_681005 [Schizopora paradoxa]|uniref:Uncharacterized protein n=1 Tax=Schizopora paradoxa TaxID=27342 RepID=A0A0H2R4J8_9AGAM|nr:hypothetical protein SCHPADRAFT_681005 [Schizopora paradoxa]